MQYCLSSHNKRIQRKKTTTIFLSTSEIGWSVGERQGRAFLGQHSYPLILLPCPELHIKHSQARLDKQPLRKMWILLEMCTNDSLSDTWDFSHRTVFKSSPRCGAAGQHTFLQKDSAIKMRNKWQLKEVFVKCSKGSKCCP